MKQTNYSYSTAKTVGYDQGLRTYMLYVYNYMVAALALTGVFAMATASSGLINMLYSANGMTGLGMIVTFAPLGIALSLGFGLEKMKLATVQLLFWLYASLLGISLSSLLIVYTGESLVKMFFITSSVFGAMSIYGYSTKKDLTSFGSFLMMALIGVIIAFLINSFMGSSGLSMILSFVMVLVFVGLTAYDTQKIKNFYYSANTVDEEMAKKIAIMGSFSLYLDFINIFLHLVKLFGARKGE